MVAALSLPAIEADADVLYYSLNIFPRNRYALIDTLVGRTKEDLESLKEVYSNKYGKQLEDDIYGNVKGDYRKFLVSVLQAGRNDQDVIQDVFGDVNALYDDGQKRWVGKDASTFFEILNTRSETHLKYVKSRFVNLMTGF